MKNSSQLNLNLGNSRKSIKDIRNFLAGRTTGITRDEALLEEVLKIILCLKNSNELDLISDPYQNSKIIRNRFSQIKKQLGNYFNENDEILLDPTSIDFLIKELIRIEINGENNIDFIGNCYEIFIGNIIKGQDGQFFTPFVAVDFLIKAVNPEKDWKIIDTACGASGFLSNLYLFFLNKYSKSIAETLIKKNLYGIEKDKYLTRLGWMHLKLLSGFEPNIINGDSLAMRGDKALDGIKDNTFDLVITNPPFGSKIKSADDNTIKSFKLGYKWSNHDNTYKNNGIPLKNVPPQVLFMERNIKLLKEGGFLATVMPESLVSNKNYKHVVDYIFKNGKVIAVIGMPESLFKTSGKGGTHTKTCLLIYKKLKKPPNNYDIFFSEAQWCGHDSRANIIPKNDLPTILENYLKFCRNELKIYSHLGYVLNKNKIENNILAPSYYDIEFNKLKKKLSNKTFMLEIRELIDRNIINISTGDEIGKLNYGSGVIPYVRTSDIASFEIRLDVKQKINREIYNKLKTKQDIRVGDILLVKDGTYLIGKLALITKYDVEIVFQSHLYKIRVNKNDLGLTPYNFLGLLSSGFVQRQIKSKQLSQDIINSIGNRIYDIALPIPKDKNVLKSMNDKVKEIIDLKEKNKYLYQEFLHYTKNELTI